MTDYDTLVARLKELAADMTSSDGCAGCGHEHNCANEGCAILRDAVATMEQLYKDVTGSCWACVFGDAPSDQEPCKSCFDGLTGETCSWQWWGAQEEKKR
ncbi:MAG: hypothetical protein LUH09_03865 [Clostridiales bacterium]|nr:hypothetical protein [Clostridiales bacterium]